MIVWAAADEFFDFIMTSVFPLLVCGSVEVPLKSSSLGSKDVPNAGGIGMTWAGSSGIVHIRNKYSTIRLYYFHKDEIIIIFFT